MNCEKKNDCSENQCEQQQSCCSDQKCCQEDQNQQESQCCQQIQQCEGESCCTGDNQIKKTVQQRYGEICQQTKQLNAGSFCGVGGCCSSSGCGTIDYAIFAENYEKLQGYVPEADLGLGCGIPTEFAEIKKGDLVLDLGSGAGNDCFIARALVGETGKVIGVDMTPVMIRKAQLNSDKYNFRNVEFRQGDIEDLPILDNFVDVVISNCVINLVPDKRKVFNEIKRVLKKGGHFSISDVLTTGDLPKSIRTASELHVGCVAGALQKDTQLTILKELGFTDIQIKKEKVIDVPDDLMLKYVSQDELTNFKNSGVKILSATLFARKG